MKIYPENYKKANDMEYSIMCGVIWGSLICVCLCVILLVIITLLIDNNIKDNSQSY